MTSVAVLIGNAVYDRENELACCAEDVAAMRGLIEATGRFDTIHAHINIAADDMRNAVRDALPANTKHDEVFFYFSGHGAQVLSDLFYCGTDYDGKKPNATGMSQVELIDLCRSASPENLVLVIDACFSGALLVKKDRQLKPVSKEGFRNVLQFASSLDSQTSLGGDKLSEFTRTFLEASVKKTEGTVYYSDLINIIRDEFIDNDDQTPFFVNQGTGREVLVDDARKLADFRDQLHSEWSEDDEDEDDEDQSDEDDKNTDVENLPALTPKQLLMAAEEKMGGPEKAQQFTNALFDGLTKKLSEHDFADFYEVTTVEHSNYREPTIRDFMIKSLARENRSDELVTAKITRKQKKPNAWEAAAIGLMSAMNAEWTEHYTLELNCKLDRAQFKITLTPKYKTLQQLRLVVSCAPSLEKCYVFELITQHSRVDWNMFDDDGKQITERWYRLSWDSSVDGIVNKAHEALQAAVHSHLESTVKRIS